MKPYRLILSLCLLTGPSLDAAARQPERARDAMVVAAEPHATRVGVDILRQGGNAVDAAIAVGLTLAVTHPTAGNLGGGGFMLLRLADGRSTFIDFRETAPSAAHRDMYLDEEGTPTRDSVTGYRAAGVPGTLRGLELAHSKYGSLKWSSLVDPAIRIARDGFTIPWSLAEWFKESTRLPLFKESRRVFMPKGRPPAYGEMLRQHDLADTLQRVSHHGPGEFYTGQTARLLAKDMKANGGLITAEDLAGYRAVERKPISGEYRGFEVLSAPPPSSGGIGVIQMLQMLEGSGYAKSGAGSAASIHYVAEVMRRYFADRAEYLGDADFADVPVEELITPAYARERRQSIHPNRVTSSGRIRPGLAPEPEANQTTHYSIVDRVGNAVSVTYTLNGLFGSGVAARGTGVLLNNEMDDFTSKPGEPNMFGLRQSERNAIEPGKRPLSAMTPTIVTRDGQLILVLGSPGGPTIISAVLQVILNVLDFRMNLQEAVDFPRFHHQWLPDVLRIESAGFSPDTIALLEQRGHKIRRVDKIAAVMAIQVDGKWLLGAADSRREGLAAGF